MATENQAMINNQVETFEKIKRLCNNFRKDSATRKTSYYLESRLDALESHWQEFEEQHKILMGMEDKNIDYFQDGIYDKLKSLYEETKGSMLALTDEISKKNTQFGNDSQYEMPGMSTEEPKQQVQDLLRQQKCNFKAFQRVQLKINTADLTEKWELEDSLNTLRVKWEAIDKLNWQLDYALASPDEAYERQYAAMEAAYDVLKKEINHKIWNNAHYEKSAPAVQIPEFSGNYSQWTSFKDLFTEVIHKNSLLHKAQKMQHLKSKLSGEAERLVRHLKTSAENYESCWELLQHRYDNRRLMCTSYITTLLNQPILQQANAFNLKKLHDVTLECLNGLINLGIDTATWDPLIVHLLCQKLDTDTYNEYIKEMKSPREPPVLEEFVMFLESKFIGYEGMRGAPIQKQSQTNNKKNNNYSKPMTFNKATNAQTFYTTARICPICKTDHVLLQCDKFLSMTIDARDALVTKMKLCRNCLFSHGNKQCISYKTCRICKNQHHTLLHANDEPITASGSQPSRIKPSSPITNRVCSITNKEKEVLLLTILLKVKNLERNYVTLRALLDQGSQVSLMTESAAQLLRIPRQKLNAVVSGIGSLSGNCKGAVTLECKSIHSQYTFSVDTLIINKLISGLPSQTFEIKDWEYLENLKLADPNFNISAAVDLLLGADIYSELIMDGIIKGNNNYPVAQQTKVGWILCGNVKTFNCFVTLNELQNITKFWESEEISGTPLNTEDHQFCENHYKETTQRQPDGKYIVKMPMKPDFEKKLGKTKRQAISQYLQLEKKMAKNANFAAQYKEFINEYSNVSHMVPVTSSRRTSLQAFLPHHGVIREDSTTTKLRVVFNASRASDSKYSLNDLMYTGPNLQKDMLTLMINWRVHKYVFTADVEKMYRNIMLHDSQQRLLTIIWRNNPTEPLQEMQLCTVTYGTKAAPYLAMRTLHQLAQDEGHLYPTASKVLRDYFYMDDLVHGQDSIEAAKQLIQDLISLLRKGGFNLRKWASNEPTILQDLTAKQRCKNQIINFKSEQLSETKTLGIGWNPELDTFTFTWNVPSTKKQPTKRSLLSDVSKLYDPLGWLSPITIKAKLLFQKLWINKIGWDDYLPIEIFKEWEKLRKDLININKVSIKRWLYCLDKQIEIHGFSDASEKAYACVVYSRTKNEAGDYVITLIAAKTKVAPISKKLSLPRLELCGALLLAKLIEKIKSTIREKQLEIFCWSDSQVVLAWIQGNSNKWERYVANRVQQINKIISPKYWQYVKSEENSADCATRGLFPSQLLNFELWWEGPKWLKNMDKNKVMEIQTYTTDIGKQSTARLCLTTKSADCNELIELLLHKYSSLFRLIRVVSWILRFIAALYRNNNNYNDTLSIEEMNSATHFIIKHVQRTHFGEDLEHLRKNGTVPRKSNLLKLTPFLDGKGIMRVNGRLQNSTLPESAKHPIILPNNGPLTKLIIEDAHKRTLHGGGRLTLAFTRQNYWIIGGNHTIKKQLRLCVRCHRFKPHKSEQIMAALPTVRVTPTRPFTNTGIDFTGHVDIKINKGRGVKTCKGYIAIFICMVTKAVHLELVSDLSTPTFLAALKRMCARRGTPRQIFSDNGTNFVGAAKQLQKDFQLYQTFTSPEFAYELSQASITWHFNAPAWPTAGGLWEAAVKSMKHHLKRVLGEQKLTYEQFTTLLSTIESCMNSRPLAPLSEDIDDLDYLTPGHFLIGGPTLAIPQHEDGDFNHLDLRNRWIWNKWSSEYLTELQTRSKWHQPKTNLEKGNLVLIKNENIPPGKWAVGRVLETHPGSDGYVRVVTLKTKGGEQKRPITKLIPFPENEPNFQEPKIATTQEKTMETNCKQNKTKPKTKRAKSGAFVLFTTMLVTFMGSVQSLPSSNYKITAIEKDHPIYYDEIGKLQLIHDEWTLLVYYNLTTYWQGITNINTYVTYIDKLCEHMTHLPCETIVKQLQRELHHLSEYNTLLLSQHQHRRKRGYFNGIGNLARTLFGTLDEEFAKKYEDDIKSMQANDRHLLELMKNQTLIIEAENNILKSNENFTRENFQKIHNYLQEISADMMTMETRLQRIVTMNDVNAASLTASLIITSLNRVQDMLLRTLSDLHKGHLDRYLFSVSQLTEQLNIISGRLPKGLSLPIASLPEGIHDIYELLYVKARITSNYLLVEVHLPLLSDDEFTVYKVIPLVFNRGDRLKIIRPSSSHIAINLLKNTYLLMEQQDLERCNINRVGNFFCIAQQPVYNMHYKNAPCEAKLFSQQNSLSCGIDEVQCMDNWVKLYKPNLWLYSSCDKYLLRIICGEDVSTETIYGNGLISIRPGCQIQKHGETIFTYNNFGSQVNVQPDMEVPSLKINSMVNTNWRHLNITAMDKPSTSMSQLAMIQHRITYQKEHETLLTNEKMSIHNICHYATSTLLVAGALAVVIYWIIKKKDIKQPQQETNRESQEVEQRTELQIIDCPSGSQNLKSHQPKTFQLDD